VFIRKRDVINIIEEIFEINFFKETVEILSPLAKAQVT